MTKQVGRFVVGDRVRALTDFGCPDYIEKGLTYRVVKAFQHKGEDHIIIYLEEDESEMRAPISEIELVGEHDYI